MPRSPRLHVPGGVYHVTLRGNHCEALFANADDRRRLDEIVAHALEATGARIHAYCWMTNHLHALVQIADRPLGCVMQRIAMRYSRYRHKAMRTTGHLFERRYGAKLVAVDAYFLSVLRYIHLNPVEAGITASPGEYPWSSHRAYLGLVEQAWLTTGFGLSLFHHERHIARRAYQAYVQAGACGHDFRDQTQLDSRLPGTDEFVSTLPQPACRACPSMTLKQYVESQCVRAGVSLESLRSPSRARVLTKTRVAIASDAFRNGIATLREIAEFLGRNCSSVSELIARHRRE